jgi:hypothetical protein
MKDALKIYQTLEEAQAGWSQLGYLRNEEQVRNHAYS